MQRIALVNNHVAKAIHKVVLGVKIGAIRGKGRIILLKCALVYLYHILAI